MRSSKEFRDAVRHGVRTGRPTLVVHARASSPVGTVELGDQVHVGFVVSKAVGNAVTRNRVKRRLRHLSASAIAMTPLGTGIVVRALPRAASHPDELAHDLDKAWTKAVHRLSEHRSAALRGARP
jgi:ribonuclease P protein component